MLTINEIRAKVAPYFRDKPVRRAYVFGSLARQEATERSDVDILVELDAAKTVGLIEYIKLMDGLEALLQRKVDLVAEDGLSRFIKPQVDREKILIYEA
ncbi:MAG: nucleotidyltransferase domain-containing protein [Cytophagaceae bacterium]|nr:nucleotidyltransferase domain-containing protein [Cytophagaceae bacterium]